MSQDTHLKPDELAQGFELVEDEGVLRAPCPNCGTHIRFSSITQSVIIAEPSLFAQRCAKIKEESENG
jgi:predicted RNA-binding Zn-ribbon protein involved in translation (DUF1610 family)